MSVEAIFGLQLSFSLVMFALIARWYVAPWLSTFTMYSALTILMLPHTFRHVGMSFLVPGLTGNGLPADFAGAAGYGDLVSALIALFAVLLLRMKSIAAIPVVWLFSIVGTVDLLNALRQAEAIPHLGVTWFIPTFIVPVLIVSQVMIFARLVSGNAPSLQRNHSDARTSQTAGN